METDARQKKNQVPFSIIIVPARMADYKWEEADSKDAGGRSRDRSLFHVCMKEVSSQHLECEPKEVGRC